MKSDEVQDLVSAAVAYMSTRVRLVADDEGVLSFARIVGPGVLEPYRKELVIGDLTRAYIRQMLPSQIANDLYKGWVALAQPNYTVNAASIKPFVFADEPAIAEGWAWQRLPLVRPADSGAPIPPLFEAMLRRTSPEEAYSMVLWLGSLLDYEFPRAQYLYIQGDGDDGKSTLIEALVGLFRQQGIALLRSDTLTGTHSTTPLEGCRLAIFADENNAAFMSKGLFKSMTGDASMAINPKGLPQRNIALHCKVLITSNYPPEIVGSHADTRRIILVRLEKIAVVQYQDGRDFVNAISDILSYCYQEFRKWRNNNPGCVKIPVSEIAMESVVADSIIAETEDYIYDIFEFGPENTHTLRAVELKNILRTHKLSARHVYSVIKKNGAYQARVRSATGQPQKRVWVGIKTKSVLFQ